MLTPPPCADWLPVLSAHEVMDPASAPFLLHINSSPSVYQVIPTSLQNHVVTSRTFTQTHTHIHSYSHMHPWFPLYFCSPLWQNSPQMVYICCPHPLLCKIINYSVSKSKGKCLSLPPWSILSSPCPSESLFFTWLPGELSPLVPLLPRKHVLPKSFRKHPLLFLTMKHCGWKSHLFLGPLIYYGSFGEVSLTALIFINAQIIPKEGNLIFKPDSAQENQTHLHKHTLNIQTCVQTHTSSQPHPNRLFPDLLSHLPRPKNLKTSQTPPPFMAHSLHEGKSYWLYFKNISRNRWVLTYSIAPTLVPVTIISHLNYSNNLQWFCLVPTDSSPQRTRVVLKYNSDQVHSSAQNPSVASQITQGKSPSVSRGLQDPTWFDLKAF